MLPADLLQILACPETKQPLSIASDELVANLDLQRKEGELINRGGATVTEPIEGGLLRSDGKVFYPIYAGIPCLLIDEGIWLSAI